MQTMQTMKWKAPALVAALLALTWLLVACGPKRLPHQRLRAASAATDAVAASDGASAPATAGRGQGDTLRLIWWQGPTILNPHLATGDKDSDASRMVYEPLASFNKDGVLVPILAAEIPSLENGGVAPDGTSVTWKLKQGVTWSDGIPFTAEDVKFTYHYVADPEQRR